MPDGIVDPPDSGTGVLQLGKADSNAVKKPIPKGVLIGGGLVALVGIYLYAKSKSASNASTTAPATLIQPASNQDSTVGNNASALWSELQSSNDSTANGLSALQTALTQAIAGDQAATIAAISANNSGNSSQNPTPAGPGTGTATSNPPVAPTNPSNQDILNAAANPPPNAPPGYGAGVPQLVALNPGGISNQPGLSDYGGSYNGVPI